MNNNDIAIEVTELGKRYRIGVAEKAGSGLRGTAKHILGMPFRYLRTRLREETEEEILWALKNVSFTVRRGEIVGMIGANGAGKSTLLKILSRITDPTEGTAYVQGRLSSLLEVGTGFHPELTGRENIYLSAAVHGMRKAEVAARFHDIVEFSGVGRFLDTPVKRYSSGMRVRLGFAVAAHLKPEILLIDEVLAVGDVEFQQKCLGRMGDVAEGGRTVLFVSHNMLAIRALCSRTILLRDGRVVADGDTEEVVTQYLSTSPVAEGTVSWEDELNRPGNEFCKMVALRTCDQNGIPTSQFESDTPITLEVEFDIERFDDNFALGFDFSSADGITIFRSVHTDTEEKDWPELRIGRNKVRCAIPGDLLGVGKYLIAAKIGLHFGPWIVDTAPILEVHVVSGRPKSRFWMAGAHRNQIISPILEWQSV